MSIVTHETHQNALPTAPHNTARTTPWYRNGAPWLLMLGPATVVLAGIHTTWLAFSHQDALVVDDYYKRGKAINQDLRRDRAAARRGITATLRYEPSLTRLAGTVRHRTGPEISSLVMQLIHPTQPQKDVRVMVQPDATGNFSVSLPMLDHANWRVLIENTARDWRVQSAWAWPQQRSVALVAE